MLPVRLQKVWTVGKNYLTSTAKEINVNKIVYNGTAKPVVKKSFCKVSGLRSMQHIKGDEREIIEAYRSELTHDIWGNAEKLKEWTYKKIEEIASKEYPSTKLTNDMITEGRTEAVKKWAQTLKENEITKNNPFLQLKILKFVTKNLQPNNKQLAPIINQSVISDTIRQINKTGEPFKRAYYENMRTFDSYKWLKTEEVSENEVLGKWYIIDIPNEIEARRNSNIFRKIKDFIAILSQGSNWCTRSPHTVGDEFSNCTANIFVDNKGIPQVCMTTVGKNKNMFEYIRGNDQYAPIAEKYKAIIKLFMQKHELKNVTIGKAGNEEPLNSYLA